jgi:hypothetical protein
VEYSLDLGQTWSILGTVSAGWYDFPNTTQTTAFPFGEPYFNAQATAFTQKSKDISFLAGNSTVAFRFVFKSDASVNDAGAAIDNFEILGPNNSALPVELISFTGTAFANHNELYWVTASETNNSGFEIQRSLNARDFSFIGTVEGAGNSSVTKNYFFSDENITSDLYYYRLKQIDFDGKENFSGIIAVVKSSSKPFEVSTVLPNPFREVFFVDFKQPYTGTILWQLVDINGKVIVAKNEVLKSSEGIRVACENDAILSGLYFMKITAGKKTQILKVIKD